MRIGPVGKVYHCPCPRARLVRLDNIQSLAVEEESVVAETPNNSLNFGTIGWSSRITWASNWLRACSTCAEFSFIAHSFGLVRKEAAYHQVVRACRVVVEAQAAAVRRYRTSSRKTLARKAKCVSPYARQERHEQLKVQSGTVGDAQQSVRADEGGEAGDGEPAAAAEIMLPRTLSLNSQPPGNKRAPTSLIFCVFLSTSSEWAFTHS
jgi:hypothetical protein